MTALDPQGNARRYAAEMFGTFALVFIGAGACIAHHGHPDDITHVGVGGLAIGAAVCIDCLAAGKCCGASMNPARSLGPALFAGGPALADLWLYFCAPTLGAMAAAVGYQQVRGGLTAATAADAGDSGRGRSTAVKP
jgi:glycerol uptake facilitator-like aquaporin